MLVPVVTADEMLQVLTARFNWATTLIMAAAVVDFRPKQVLSQKLKKEQWTNESLLLERTPDILLKLSSRRTHQRMIGFAAETENLIEHGQVKLHNKQLDMLVVNQVGDEHSAFGNDSNEVILLTPDSSPHPISRMPKRQLADILLDHMLTLPLPSSAVQTVSPSIS